MESPPQTSLNDLKDIYQEADKTRSEAAFAAIKEQLALKAATLKLLQEQRDEADRRSDSLGKEINLLLDEIRTAWTPFIHGSSETVLKFDNGFSIVSKEELSITCEDSDTANEWFLKNGYEGVMKYQIHNQTMKKIARELYEKGQAIPSIKYNKYRYVKVK